MNSPAWEARKRRYFRRHPKRCRRCGTEGRIALHHRTYVRLTVELDADLVPLCEPCHSDLHHAHRTGLKHLSLGEATDLFLEPGPAVNRPAPAAPFVPQRQRLTRDQRTTQPISGRAGRLAGLPVREESRPT